MAHDKCIGTWEKSRLDTEEDGKIKINTHSGTTFTGRHLNTGASLTDTFCDGTTIRFSRVDTAKRVKVNYNGEMYVDGNKHRIRNGHFTKEPVVTDSQPAADYQAQPSADKSARPTEPATPPNLTDTWESEKAT